MDHTSGIDQNEDNLLNLQHKARSAIEYQLITTNSIQDALKSIDRSDLFAILDELFTNVELSFLHNEHTSFPNSIEEIDDDDDEQWIDELEYEEEDSSEEADYASYLYPNYIYPLDNMRLAIEGITVELDESSVAPAYNCNFKLESDVSEFKEVAHLSGFQEFVKIALTFAICQHFDPYNSNGDDMEKSYFENRTIVSSYNSTSDSKIIQIKFELTPGEVSLIPNAENTQLECNIKVGVSEIDILNQH